MRFLCANCGVDLLLKVDHKYFGIKVKENRRQGTP